MCIDLHATPVEIVPWWHAQARNAVRSGPMRRATMHELLAFVLLALLASGCTSSAISPLAVQHNHAGAELLGAGDLERAEANFRLALEYAPGLPEARMNLGVLALRRGRPALAEEELRAAIGLREDFPEAWANLGAALEAQGRTGEAEDAYLSALAIHPGLAVARRNVGRLLLSEARHVEARAHLLRLLESDPTDREGHALLAWCELLLGRPDAAAARLRYAFADAAATEDARVVPPVAYLVRAIAELREGSLEEALRDLTEAERDRTLHREVALRRAAIEVVLGDPTAAMARLGPLLEDDPFDAAAHLLMARASADLDDPERAIEHAHAALELAPDLEAARVILRELEAR